MNCSALIQEESQAVRIEKAKDLLNFWAYAHFRYTKRVEFKVGYTGNSVMTNILGGKAYKPLCFKTKTNAKETRAKQGTRIPIGGNVDVNTNLDRAIKIDRVFQEKLSPNQIMLVMGLFMPPGAYVEEKGGKRPSDGKIAKAFGFKPARACQIKLKAIELVVVEIISPVFEV